MLDFVKRIFKVDWFEEWIWFWVGFLGSFLIDLADISSTTEISILKDSLFLSAFKYATFGFVFTFIVCGLIKFIANKVASSDFDLGVFIPLCLGVIFSLPACSILVTFLNQANFFNAVIISFVLMVFFISIFFADFMLEKIENRISV